MGSTFTTFPDVYDQTSVLGTKKKLPVYIQFVPGMVIKVTTGEDSISCEGDLSRLGSIIAMPHFGDKGIRKPSLAGEEFRYYPLLRGVQEAPTPGDPVVLCTIGGVQYYLGPLNTEGLPNFNADHFRNNQVKNSVKDVVYSEGSLETKLFVKEEFSRLQKLLNPKLDSPVEWEISQDENTDMPFISNAIHGDLVLEGRHGNSIRVGSRNIHPYIIISNGRAPNNPVETSLDGTVLAILENGSVRDHFNLDQKIEGTEKNSYQFALADDEKQGEVHNSISKTFAHPLGSGRVADEEDISMNDKIYNYNENQLFASSDRVTFNARKESMFLAAREHIHIGCGSSMTFSTSDNIFTQAARSVVTNTPLFKVNSDTTYIDGRTKVVIGNPLLNDNCQPAVVGHGLVTQLALIIYEIKNLAHAVSEAIENRGRSGGSLDIMNARVDALDRLLGVEEYEDPILDKSYQFPVTLSKLILSDKVFIKR